MSIEHHTTLRCDLCGLTVAWDSQVSHTMARKVARQKYGWRRDKLSRDVCKRHPTLTPQKAKEK